MIAAFSQFHHRVHQRRNIRAFAQIREVSFKNGAIVLLLDVGELHLKHMPVAASHKHLYRSAYFDNGLFLWFQRFLHVFFQSPQHHRFQDFLQLLYLIVRLQLSEFGQEKLTVAELPRFEEI